MKRLLFTKSNVCQRISEVGSIRKGLIRARKLLTAIVAHCLVAEHHLLITPEVDLEIFDPENRVFYEKLLGKYFSVQRPKNAKISLEQVRHLVAFLGKGEVSVILLASELDATAVLDERLARMEAEKLKLSVTGTLGILADSIKRNWCTDGECIEIVRRLHTNRFRVRRPGLNETFMEYFMSFG